MSHADLKIVRRAPSEIAEQCTLDEHWWFQVGNSLQRIRHRILAVLSVLTLQFAESGYRFRMISQATKSEKDRGAMYCDTQKTLLNFCTDLYVALGTLLPARGDTTRLSNIVLGWHFKASVGV